MSIISSWSRVCAGTALLSLLAMALATNAEADQKKKRKKYKGHHYHGVHPLSVSTEAGFCYIEVPHLHPTKVHKKHRPLYREHEGHQVFVADPFAYGYSGERHSYYGHHPVAIEVLLESENTYTSGQDLEFCYLDGPHYHAFAPQPGLRFEQQAGASWYIGQFPEAYTVGKVHFEPVNRIYASLEVERPSVVFEAPPTGYVGPILSVQVSAPAVVVEQPHVEVDIFGHSHSHSRPGQGTAEIRAAVEVQIPTPRLEIGFGLGQNSHTHDRRAHKHKHKHSKSKSKSKFKFKSSKKGRNKKGRNKKGRKGRRHKW